MTTQETYVFSDGNCKKNGMKGAIAGFSAYFQNEKFANFNYTEILTTEEKTNNIAELSAIKYIVDVITDNSNIFRDYKIIICTDSMYSINCLTKWYKNWVKNNWVNSKKEPVKNKQLIQNILEKLTENISFKHVSAHKSQPSDKNSIEWMLWNGNNIVDTNINKKISLMSSTE